VVNDVSALADPALAPEVAAHDASLIATAAPGPGRTSTTPIETVRAVLGEALARARAAGIADEHIVLDPGIGFFRQAAVPWHEWDVAILAGLPALRSLGRPLCVGVSRKSFIGALTGHAATGARLAGSLAATAAAVLGGAALIRTHDVRETVDAVRVAERIRRAAP
jgi:dihydropteroate synthase